MKTHKFLYSILFTLLLVAACKQEVITRKDPDGPEPQPDPEIGSLDLTKFIAVGSSYVAGMQAGALFTDGQDNSLPAILNKQFVLAGGTAEFNQPDINATLGYNIFVSPNPGPDGHVLGRMLLQPVDDPAPTPQPYGLGDLEAVPNPSLNPGFIYAGTNSDLNNFGVEAITLGQYLTPATGNWGVPDPAQGFSPFYARFASNPGTSSIITDVDGAGGTFFLLWAGMDDFMLYAAYGGDGSKAPLTDVTTFTARFGYILYHPSFGMLTINPALKGVVANFPDIFVMPHFTAIAYNPIPLDAATADLVNGGFAGYNAALDGLIANKAAFGISDALATEIETRKVTVAAVLNNKILIRDTHLVDLGPYFDGLQGVGAITPTQRAQLAPYQRVRQTTPEDIIPLGAGAILGTLVNADPTLVNGVTVPLKDQYCIVPEERDSINDARTGFNAAIAATVTADADHLVLADVSAALATLVQNKAAVMNGVTITPKIDPPTGIYSEDGIHPNTRGYAYLSTVILGAINGKTAWGAYIPLTDISLYGATGLPIP